MSAPVLVTRHTLNAKVFPDVGSGFTKSILKIKGPESGLNLMEVKIASGANYKALGAVPKDMEVSVALDAPEGFVVGKPVTASFGDHKIEGTIQSSALQL